MSIKSNSRGILQSVAAVGVLAVTFSLPAGQAQAQTSTRSGIELVTVTAERRTTLLQRTPIAVTAISGETLARKRIDTFADLSLHVPNLTYTQFSTQESYLSIRGTLINNNAAGWDDAVTTFIDGVPTTGLGDQNPDLFDLASIEVLRGPQGTLFGRNVTGGAVVISTLQPSFDEGAKLEASYGNYNAVQARGYVTGPISDDLAGKISVSYNYRDPFIRNVTLGGKTNGTNQIEGRVQLLWTPNADLDILFGADYLHDTSGGYASRLDANFLPALFPTLSYRPNDTNQAFNGFQHRDIGGGLIRVTWRNSLGVLTSISGYRDVSNHFPNSVLGDPENELLADNVVDDKQFTQEVNLASPSDQQLTWVAGLFYLHSSKRQGGPLVFAFDPATVAGIFSAVNNYTQTAIQDIATDSYAIYGEANFAASDTWKLTVGARETWETKGGTSTVTYSIADPNLFPAVSHYSHTWSAFTPRVILSWQADDQLMLYASVTRGFKSGGYDLSGTGASSVAGVTLALATPFNNETEMSYEVGEKFAAYDGRLVINGTAFLADYKNLQTSALVLLSNNELANITSNSPGTSPVQGFELESTALPTDWLTLGLVYGYLDAHFTDNTRIPYTPRHQINVSADTHFPVPELDGEISVAGDFTYHSKVIFNPGEIPAPFIFNRSAWNGIFNAHIDYTTDDQAWRVSLWGKNLTDERAFLRASNVSVLFQTIPEFLNPDDFLYLVKYFPERTFGISVTHSL
jgi:iron complex outermembrane receptor protein